MTIFYPNSSIQNTAGDNPVAPGNAPVPNAAGIMNGNPAGSQYQPQGVQPPLPMNTPSAPLTTQIANGQIPLQTQPTNANVAPGLDSLLAQMSRGQVILCDSTYGQGSLVQNFPGGGGNTAATIVPIPTGPASGVTIATPPVYTGN
jgi:hypothetical protein